MSAPSHTFCEWCGAQALVILPDGQLPPHVATDNRPCAPRPIPYETCPSPHCVVGVRNYFEHGVRPGGFVLAVLEGDMEYARLKADHLNAVTLSQWPEWLGQYAPIGSWGSAAIVRSWMERQRHLAALRANQ